MCGPCAVTQFNSGTAAFNYHRLRERLRVPNRENALDKLIAATALIHDLTVVTRNHSDFTITGARVFNPFT